MMQRSPSSALAFLVIPLLGLASIPLFLAPASASAQQPPDSAVVLENLVVVVGSRAETADPAELAVPVDIYGEEELARLGEIDLGELLGRIAPSYNSTRYSAGDGAALHVATLRGMSPDQVLVLVNGKRRHGVAFPKVIAALGYGSLGTDLRAIPIHAIKRIEVLRAGAASQYGSDAIAGVVNIVLKDADYGATANTYLSRTSRNDGERLLASGNTGIPLGNGFLNLTMEYSRQNPTIRASEAPTCFGPDPDYAPCANGGKMEFLQRNGEPDYEGGAVMFNAALPAGESAELYAFGGFARRSADLEGLYRKADWTARSVSYVYPDGFIPHEMSDLTDGSAVFGMRGDMGAWSYDLSSGFGQGQFAFGAANTINPSFAAEYVARNPGASPSAIASNAGARSVHSGTTNVRQWMVNADAARDLALGDMPLHLAVGAAFRRGSFWMGAGDLASYACGSSNSAGSFPAAHENNSGGMVASCGVQGFPGYSPASASASRKSRSSAGGYADIELEPSEALSVGGSFRFENYSDAGNSLTGGVNGRLALGESGFAVRSAVSTGFRAPRLPQRGFNTVVFQGGSGGLTSTAFLPEGHTIACQDFEACSLKHETSFSLGGGLVYANDSGLLVTADYYRVAVADAIVLTPGLGPDHGLRAGVQFQGRPVDGVAFWTNAIDTRTQGFDLFAGWRFRGMSWGSVDISTSYHRNSTVITKNRNPDFVRETQTLLITEAQPKQRVGTTVDVRSAGGIGARVAVNYIGGLRTPTVFEAPVDISGGTIVDAEATVLLASRIRLGIGVNNLFDKLPDRLPSDHVAQMWSYDYPSESPYGVMGRIMFVRMSILAS